MVSFDIDLVRFINQFAGDSPFLDGLAGFLVTSGLVKGAVLFCLVYCAGFGSDQRVYRPGTDRW